MASPDPWSIPDEERRALEAKAGVGAAVYGEVTAKGTRTLLAALRPDADDVFYDLGSGGGGIVLQAVAETKVGRAIGIELSPTRHHAALHALARAARADDRAAFIQADLAYTPLDDATLIFAGSLCFGDALLSALARRAAAAVRLRRLVTLKPLPIAAMAPFRQIAAIDLETTWSARTRAIVLQPQ